MLVRRKKIYRKREFLPAVAVKVSGASWITNKRLSAKPTHRTLARIEVFFASAKLRQKTDYKRLLRRQKLLFRQAERTAFAVLFVSGQES